MNVVVCAELLGIAYIYIAVSFSLPSIDKEDWLCVFLLLNTLRERVKGYTHGSLSHCKCLQFQTKLYL